MIILYSKDNCRYCVAVATYLKNNGVDYTEKNIDHDPAAKEHILAKGYTSIPVTEVEGKEDIIGFDLERLRELV